MYVHRASAFICEPAKDMDALKEDLKNYTDYFFRRINRFILLSLMGVHRCVHGAGVSQSVALYLATENGNLGDTENVLSQIYKENSFPKPFNFINTMSNTASFYVAQSLKSEGRSITVSSKNASFERGLALAKVDFGMNLITEALVGGVDEAVFSREYFVKKYDDQYHGVKLVDGSSWLYLKARRDGALGEVADIKTFTVMDDALQWAQCLPNAGPVTLSFGILVPTSERDVWKNECPYDTEFEYLHAHGFYDTVSSFAASDFFQGNGKGRFIHVNKNVQGQYVMMACIKY